jgi:hypothetical protein
MNWAVGVVTTEVSDEEKTREFLCEMKGSETPPLRAALANTTSYCILAKQTQ